MAERRVSVFGSGTCAEGTAEYALAQRLGALLAAEGYVVYTGGYDGAMAAASRGAHAAGGQTVGVTLVGDLRAPNRWVRTEIRTADLHERLGHLLGTEAWVAVDGAVGTLNEVALGWALLQKQPRPGPPLVLIGPRWRQLIAAVAAILAVPAADLALVTHVDTAEAAVAALGGRLAGRTAGDSAHG